MLVGSIAYSYDPGRSLRDASELLSLATLLLAPRLLRRRLHLRTVRDGLIVVATLCAVIGLGQFLFGYGALDQRIRGPFSHYMTFAGVLLLADCLLLARLMRSDGRTSGWWWAAVAIINAALLGSLTRSAWVALFVVVTVLLLLRAPRLVLAYLPAGLLFFVLAPLPVIQRVASIADLESVSNYDRLCMLDAGGRMIRERPLLGLGPRMVEELYPLYRHPTAPRHSVSHLHNSYLQLAAERGIPGLLAMVWLLASGLVPAWRRFRGRGGFRGATADLDLGVALSLVAFLIAGLFENNWGDTEVQRVVLFLVAVPHCLASIEDEEHGMERG